jgi:hypothetical protein
MFIGITIYSALSIISLIISIQKKESKKSLSSNDFYGKIIFIYYFKIGEVMKIYKLACICTFIILLSGCNIFPTKTEVPTTKVTAEDVKDEPVVLHKEKENEPVVVDITNKETDDISIESSHPIATEINEEVASPIGESKSYFTYEGDVPFKISVSNTGTESFLYKIRNVDKETKVVNGVLKSKESFEKIFKGFPEGAYVISYVVEEEESPIDIKLKVKVEVLDP